MNEDIKQREYLSALADGELQGAPCTQTLAFAASDEGRELWAVYHLVGDTLRSNELARHGRKDVLAAVRAEMSRAPLSAAAAQPHQAPLQLQPGALAQVAAPAQTQAANGAVFRWKMVAGFASLAAVSVLGWNMALVAGGGTGAAATVATAPAPVSASVQVAARAVPSPVVPVATTASAPAAVATLTAQANAPAEPVMLRDPRLDELVAAHSHYHGANNLQMPAGFLRNATFASQPSSR